jgi:hypothetical protein
VSEGQGTLAVQPLQDAVADLDSFRAFLCRLAREAQSN